jgi:hypothetical protein
MAKPPITLDLKAREIKSGVPVPRIPEDVRGLIKTTSDAAAWDQFVDFHFRLRDLEIQIARARAGRSRNNSVVLQLEAQRHEVEQSIRRLVDRHRPGGI